MRKFLSGEERCVIEKEFLERIRILRTLVMQSPIWKFYTKYGGEVGYLSIVRSVLSPELSGESSTYFPNGDSVTLKILYASPYYTEGKYYSMYSIEYFDTDTNLLCQNTRYELTYFEKDIDRIGRHIAYTTEGILTDTYDTIKSIYHAIKNKLSQVDNINPNLEVNKERRCLWITNLI